MTLKRLCALTLSLGSLSISAHANTIDLNNAMLVKDMHKLTGTAMSGRKAGSEGASLAADYIASRFSQLGYAVSRQEFTFPSGIFSRDNGLNIVASNPEDTRPAIVLTAHYDHLGIQGGKIHPGANDNASGVAAMLTLADRFREHTLPFQLIFVATDAEENGLHGAYHFVKNHGPSRILLNVNLDMLAPSKRKPRLYGYTTSAFAKQLPALDIENGTLKVRYTYSSRTLNRLTGDQRVDWKSASDHHAFARAGIPFIYFGVGEDRHYHSPDDKSEVIDFALLHASVDHVESVIGRLQTVPAFARRLDVQIPIAASAP